MICSVSVMVSRYHGDFSFQLKSVPLLLSVHSTAEAIGIGYQVADRKWPAKDGWSHRVGVTSRLWDIETESYVNDGKEEFDGVSSDAPQQ